MQRYAFVDPRTFGVAPLGAAVRGVLGAAAMLCAGTAQAVEVDFSGFASVVAGRTFGDCVGDSAMAPKYAASCTRFIADWSHAGVYTPDWSLSEESRLGLQWTAKFSPTLSGTAQVVGRLNDGHKVNLEWAYLSWKPAADWTLQVGRKRLPLYFYSDFQDIGYAYTTVRPTPDVYGWDVVNYNGANLAYSTEVGDWSLRSSVFAGSENSKDNLYTSLSYTEHKTVRWNGIRGIDLELAKDWLTVRASIVQADYEQKDQASGQLDVQPSGGTGGKHTLYGIAFIADYENWLGRAEFAIADRGEYAYKAKANLIGIGYRLGKFTPMLSVSDYSETTRFPDAYATTQISTRSAVLRYELSTSSALKLQFDRAHDHSVSPYSGNAKVLSLAYDLVF
jgi:hypothetical protein